MIAAYASSGSDAERKGIVDRLEKGLDNEQKRRWRPLLEWEASCVQEGDVPYFWFYAGERALRGDRKGVLLIEDFLLVSPIESAKERIRSMDEYDLSVQCGYIRSSLRHIDGWTDPAARFLSVPVIEPKSFPEPLSKEIAVSEAVETLCALWEDRIPLSGGRCLWHVPLINGKLGSLYGLSQGFSGIGVFCHAASRSSLLRESDAALARELANACLRDMLAFGGYLLNEYPSRPEKRIIARRFEGGFGFEEGLAGFLWALEHFRDEGDSETGQMLEAFTRWNIGECSEKTFESVFQTVERPWPDTDILFGGVAGRAASLLLAYRQGDHASLDQAGRLLAWMYERKKKSGSYMVFREGRKQYFLPAFLQGNVGIAGVMLHYAALS
jgi:hypothetical protein